MQIHLRDSEEPKKVSKSPQPNYIPKEVIYHFDIHVEEINTSIEVTQDKYYLVWKDCQGIVEFKRKDNKYYITVLFPNWLRQVNKILSK